MGLCERLDSDIAYLRLLWVGNDGILRAKEVSTSRISSEQAINVTAPKTLQSLTNLGSFAENGPFGQGDEAVLYPIEDTYRKLPYTNRTGAIICELRSTDHNIDAIDPRIRLKRLLEAMGDQFKPLCGFEPEFYLTQESGDLITPMEHSPHMSTDDVRLVDTFVHALVDVLSEQDIPFSAYHPEFGSGQQEILIEPEAGLTAADNQLFYRQSIKSVATEYGYNATFAPHPISNQPPSGCHINISLWSRGRNLFYKHNSTENEISQIARYFVGGLINHAPAILGLTAPNITSYRRLRHHSISDFASWGYGNRNALIRVPKIPSTNEGQARIEFKAVDNTANPYLALLGVLAAGYSGIQNEIQSNKPLAQDTASISESEKQQYAGSPLPQTLSEALDALEADTVIKTALGDTLSTSYIATKRQQITHFEESEMEKEEYCNRQDQLF
jgi:glutamine synthetase